MRIDPKSLTNITESVGGPYGYGTNLKAKNPKASHKYVQHLKNMRNAGYATAREICPEVKGVPISHEFAQYCKLGLAEKFADTHGNVFYKITSKGKDLLKRAGV